MGCENSFESCFCVSMETNKTSEYHEYIKVTRNDVYYDGQLEICFDEAEASIRSFCFGK